jgi:hypothetical protein
MFRYGGPIKEGVMSGIKEPVRKAALVGNSVYPQTGGREHHNWFKTILGFGTRAGAGTGVKEATKKTVGTETVKGIKSLWQKYGPTWPKATRTGQLGEGKGVWEAGKGFKEIPIPKMERFGKFVKQNPWWTAGGTLYGGKPVLEAGKAIVPPVAKTIADLAVPDWIYNWETGRWFNPDDTDLKPSDKKILDEKITEKVTEKIVPEVPQKTEEEIRNERIQKYRDIMDIKGMNKEAAYDSLIAASKAVGESGDFKGDIKSGKLINQIIQSTSKAYDKPADMKKAIDTLILKGEIQKDIAGAKPSQYEIKEDYLTGNLGAVIGKRVSLQKPGTLSDALLLTKGTDTKTNRTSQALRSYFDGYLTPKFEGIISSDKIKKLGGKEKLIEGESISLDNGVYQVSKGYILVEDNKIIKQEDLFTGKD